MGHVTVIHGVFLLLLCLITKKCSSQTILFGVFYDNAYQAILKTSSKELNTTSNTSIIRRDFSLNEFLYQIQNIGEKIAKAGSERSFLFTDASSLGKEIMKEVVNTRNEPVSKVRRIIIVDNAFSREVQVSNYIPIVYNLPDPTAQGSTAQLNLKCADLQTWMPQSSSLEWKHFD